MHLLTEVLWESIYSGKIRLKKLQAGGGVWRCDVAGWHAVWGVDPEGGGVAQITTKPHSMGHCPSLFFILFAGF